MRNDDLKITDNDKMRLHYKKRSGKNVVKKEYSAPGTHELISPENATEEEKKAYASVCKNEKPVANVYPSTKNRNGKIVMVDPKLENNRKLNTKIEKTVYTAVAIVALVAVVMVVIGFVYNSTQGQQFLNSIGFDNRISPDGNYNFGEFEGYVTIGTSLDDAVEILGLPTPGSDEQYFYGSSYILVENDVVVGYHKDGAEHFPVTVGYKDENVNPVVSIGDTAKRVVSKLGSPDTYHKYQWFYNDMNHNFVRNNYYSSESSQLVVTFNEKYLVIGYEFIKQ